MKRILKILKCSPFYIVHLCSFATAKRFFSLQFFLTVFNYLIFEYASTTQTQKNKFTMKIGTSMVVYRAKATRTARAETKVKEALKPEAAPV